MNCRRFGTFGKMLRTIPACMGLIGIIGLTSCGRHPGAASQGTSPAGHPADFPATAPAPAGPQTYLNQKYKIQFQYPGDWTPRENKDVTFYLVPSASPSSGTAMTLDIPNIPIHIPGMVTMNRVEKGFLDDLKKDAAKSQILEDQAFEIPAARAKRILATWDVNGASHTQDAVIIIHNDQVYILEIECLTEKYEALKKTFEEVVGSLQWVAGKS